MTQQTQRKITLKPLGNRVLAQRSEQEEVLKGGIILPDSAKKKQESATIVAVGPGKRKDDGSYDVMDVKVGDQILIDKYAGQEITVDDVEYIILKSDDIIAIIE